MKTKIRALVTFSLILALGVIQPVYAGTWTHTHSNEWGSYTYDNLWFYIKDDGNYADNEWILDNGIWYWIDGTGSLAIGSGVAKDGYVYNSDGIWVDTTKGDKWFLTRESAALIKDDMTYEQVVAILGREHEIVSSSQTITSWGTYDYITLKWLSADTRGDMYVYFMNGRVYYCASYWT